MAPPLLLLKDISLSFGSTPLLSSGTLSIGPSQRLCLVGRNGSGKSTLLKIAAGMIEPDAGSRFVQPGVTIRYLPQSPDLTGFATALAFVEAGLAPGDDPHRARYLLETLGLTGAEEPARLSGGESRRAALARVLAPEPDILLLDEPTNHLDAESVAWLEHHLRDYPGTVVMVTHDRYFLDNITEWTLELDRGAGVPYHGSYSSWLEQKQKRLAVEGKQDAAKERTLARELDWIRASPKARQAKSKARIRAYDELLADAARDQTGKAQITIPPGPRLGDIVIEADHIAKGFGDALLIDDLSFKLPPGGIVGVIGPNGAGKTTLFRMIVGQDKPDNGAIRVGDTVKFGYVDQSRDALDGKKTVFEEISGGNDVIKLGAREVPSRAYVGWFNFKGPDQQKKVGQLSGGERNRVHLARMLKSGANLILLDEPTNDLDVETLSSLEAALEDFPGCAVIISHDRFFLDRIATHILSFEGDSHVEWFEGNFESYEEDKKRRLGDDAIVPKRIKYKKFARG